MKEFIGNEYLLNSPLANRLYHDFAKELPIIDYHCHLDAMDIANDKKYDNPAEIMLGGDHYKWRLMRATGIDESYITGGRSGKEKFRAFAKALELAPGHAVYNWTHMELATYFGYKGNLNADTADEVWDIACDKLRNGLSVQKIIVDSNVEVICTTDDPADDLSGHLKCAENSSIGAKILPTFRPDKAVNITDEGFAEYVSKLSEMACEAIEELQGMKKALKNRFDYFIGHGCKIADHGVDKMVYAQCSEDEADMIFKKALEGNKVTEAEKNKYMFHMLCFFAEMYSDKDVIMQIHYGAMRNLNSIKLSEMGPDTGYDSIGDTSCGYGLAKFLDFMESKEMLPKVIVYSLNPVDNALIDTIAGSFSEAGIKGKVQHGAAWWFNDTFPGIKAHLDTYASLTPVGTFLGMLTDSRCFLSFSRHDYFRRIFCNYIADQVNEGAFPDDERLLKKIVQNVSYYNAKEYFGFQGEKL